MQTILHIPSIVSLPAPYLDESGRLALQPAHIVGDEALAVVHDPAPDLLAHVTVIGRVVNDNGEPAPRIAPEHQTTYDRLWPRTPVTWTDESGTYTTTPSALFGCLGMPQDVPLETIKAWRIDALRASCQASVFEGFVCDTLGAPHLYPCKQDTNYRDQSNLSGLVLESALPGTPADWTCKFWCADAAGDWELRTHTVAQIQAVGRAAAAHIGAAVVRCDALTRQVQAASTSDEAEAVTW